MLLVVKSNSSGTPPSCDVGLVYGWRMFCQVVSIGTKLLEIVYIYKKSSKIISHVLMAALPYLHFMRLCMELLLNMISGAMIIFQLHTWYPEVHLRILCSTMVSPNIHYIWQKCTSKGCRWHSMNAVNTFDRFKRWIERLLKGVN